MNFIPVNTPALDGNEKKYLNECVETGWISSEGPFIKKFEDALATAVNRKYGIAVANGTAAIDIAIEALGISKGDEVIMPTFTIISCITQIVRAGAKAVFVDSAPLTWNMDVAQIEAKITSRTKAIMVVHIYGLPADMAPIILLANKYNLTVIEDAAEMHGQTYNGAPCGSFGDISTFSFYPNKHITTGEGGMILTNNEVLAEKCKSLRNLCFMPHKRFVHEHLGWNYRMTNLQAALGVAQLENLEKHIIRKREIGNLYQSLLHQNKHLQLPVAYTDYATNIYWVFGLVLRDSISYNAEEAMRKLAAKNIGTRPFFYPMHKQPVFNNSGLYLNEHYPVAENLAERGFYLPSGIGLTDDEIHYIAEQVNQIFN